MNFSKHCFSMNAYIIGANTRFACNTGARSIQEIQVWKRSLQEMTRGWQHMINSELLLSSARLSVKA